MQIESIIRQTLDVKRHVAKQVLKEAEGLVVELDVRHSWRQPCGVYGTLSRVRDRLATRHWRHVPLWGIPVMLCYVMPRPECAVNVVARYWWNLFLGVRGNAVFPKS